MKRRHIVQLAAATLVGPALTARAQAFPAKPIKLIIAFPAGGPTDITMRSLADNASKILGQPVIVESPRYHWACSACPTPPRSTGTR